VVAKPSEITPMTAFMLSEIAMECGLPPGVLNIVHGTGPGVGEPIVAHPLVKAVSFTGGTSTGRKIASIAAPMFKKLSLELGGKNPSIVFADADFDKALKGTILAAFSNQGQICLCGSRLYVEKPVYEKFKEAFVEKASQLRVGDPLENETQVGALVSESHMNKVLAYIELAQREGGKILCGGERIKLQGRCANGYFVAPTVIEGLSINCRTNQEEIFGPVVTIEPFETIDELLDKANGVEYGLAANLWTQDINKALYVSEHLEAGIVWVNTWLLRDLRTPFGGMKNSGVGREGGFEALKFFTEPKNVCIKYY
jgi:aminomuconate-semialdehyde/2-hydroxymuconate-6-semialdehyde dehydrogenase